MAIFGGHSEGQLFKDHRIGNNKSLDKLKLFAIIQGMGYQPLAGVMAAAYLVDSIGPAHHVNKAWVGANTKRKPPTFGQRRPCLLSSIRDHAINIVQSRDIHKEAKNENEGPGSGCVSPNDR